jgi:hypothetical protein
MQCAIRTFHFRCATCPLGLSPGKPIDIRRQNMLEILMLKALFEVSPDRADFVAPSFQFAEVAAQSCGPDGGMNSAI